MAEKIDVSGLPDGTKDRLKALAARFNMKLPDLYRDAMLAPLDPERPTMYLTANREAHDDLELLLNSKITTDSIRKQLRYAKRELDEHIADTPSKRAG